MGRRVRQGLVRGGKGRRAKKKGMGKEGMQKQDQEGKELVEVYWPQLPYSAEEIVKAVVTPTRPMKS